MCEQSSGIPLEDVLRAANDLVVAGRIKDYAIGGALAAIHYIEPVATYDVNIFFTPSMQDLSAGIPQIYDALREKGWGVEGDHLLLKDFPVQFFVAHGLTEEAVRAANRIDYKGVPAKIFRAEHVIAIAASVGRNKDLARIDQMVEQAEIDRELLREIMDRYKLALPN